MAPRRDGSPPATPAARRGTPVRRARGSGPRRVMYCAALVDRQHGLAPDAAIDECLERVAGVLPALRDGDLGVEPTGGHLLREEAEVAGGGLVAVQLVEHPQPVQAGSVAGGEPAHVENRLLPGGE